MFGDTRCPQRQVVERVLADDDAFRRRWRVQRGQVGIRGA
jgi:hypothetical protein